MRGHELISIGQLSERTGLSVSAIRFYEAEQLLRPERNKGGHRRFLRADIRRLSFIIIVQQLGFSIKEIRAMIATLPESRVPTKADWTKISGRIRSNLENRIAMLERLKSNLDGCIGCGCLSLAKCKLFNPDDRANTLGKGARYVLSNEKPRIK
jgi:MerR family transcriptional regulator, redox-sensitive transcriptional activator SoxR